MMRSSACHVRARSAAKTNTLRHERNTARVRVADSPRGRTTVTSAERSTHTTSAAPATKARACRAITGPSLRTAPCYCLSSTSVSEEFCHAGHGRFSPAGVGAAERFGVVARHALDILVYPSSQGVDERGKLVAGSFAEGGWGAVDFEDEVLLLEPGSRRGTAVDDLHDLDAEASVEGVGRAWR